MFNTNTVTKLQKQSDDALSIFKNTLKKLADTNAEARTARAKKLEEILKLQEEEAQIATIITGNEKLSSKINEFLES